MSFLPNPFANNGTSDAFGRLRISTPTNLFESKLVVDQRDDLFDTDTTGAGATITHNANASSVTLAVSSSLASTMARQSHLRHSYQAGKSQLILLTAVVGTTSSGNTKRVGLFDDQNGYYFKHDGTGWSVGLRSYTSGSAVDTDVAQASWNGAGASSYTIDETKSQIFGIDFEWLGVGIVRFFVVLEDGSVQLLHTFQNPNNIVGVYLTCPTLPVRYEITNDGTGPAESLDMICSSVMSEAGKEFTGRILAADRGITPLSTGVDTNIYPLLAIRLKSTHARFASVDVEDWRVFTDENAAWRCFLSRNSTTAGTALSFSSAGPESPIEVATPTAGTTVTAVGDIVSPPLYGKQDANNGAAPSVGSRSSIPIQIGVTPDLTSDIIYVCVQNIDPLATDYWSSISWRETV